MERVSLLCDPCFERGDEVEAVESIPAMQLINRRAKRRRDLCQACLDHLFPNGVTRKDGERGRPRTPDGGRKPQRDRRTYAERQATRGVFPRSGHIDCPFPECNSKAKGAAGYAQHVKSAHPDKTYADAVELQRQLNKRQAA